MPAQKISKNVEHYLTHLNSAGFGFYKLFLQLLRLFGSLVGFKDTESTNCVLSSVTRNDRLHIAIRITSQCWKGKLCGFALSIKAVMLNATSFLENYTGHLQVSFMLAFQGSFSSEGIQSVSNQALNANVTLYL